MKLLALLPLAFAAFTAGAQSDTAFVPVRVNRGDEFHPVAGSGYLAWAHPRRNGPALDTYLARRSGRPLRINPHGTSAIPGGINRATLAYVQWSRAQPWSLMLYDLRTGRRRDVEQRDDTPCLYQSAYDPPSISGKLLLYGSQFFSGSSCVALHSLSTGRDILLERGGAFGANVAAGQITGRYAVWTSCGRVGCRIRLRDISTHSTNLVAVEPEASGASVGRSGTVYFVRRSPEPACGSSLVRIPLDGSPQELGAPGKHVRIGSTYAVSLKDRTIVYFDAARCPTGDGNIYAYVDRGPSARLTSPPRPEVG
jgi:hypothetical protein